MKQENNNKRPIDELTGFDVLENFLLSFAMGPRGNVCQGHELLPGLLHARRALTQERWL